MKTQQAIKLAGSAKALADLLGITQSAISQWGESVPPSRVWQLKVLRPAWFTGAVPEPENRRSGKVRRVGPPDRRKSRKKGGK
jgi:transcriptional repressor of cell division inhibition gene dicB